MDDGTWKYDGKSVEKVINTAIAYLKNKTANINVKTKSYNTGCKALHRSYKTANIIIVMAIALQCSSLKQL